jgi:hypothetical protein
MMAVETPCAVPVACCNAVAGVVVGTVAAVLNWGRVPLQDIANHGLVCTISSKFDDTVPGEPAVNDPTRNEGSDSKGVAIHNIANHRLICTNPSKSQSTICSLYSQQNEETHGSIQAGAKNRIRAGCRYNILQITDWFANPSKPDDTLGKPRRVRATRRGHEGSDSSGVAIHNIANHRVICTNLSKSQSTICSLCTQLKRGETLHYPSRREESNSGGAPLHDCANRGLICSNPQTTNKTKKGILRGCTPKQVRSRNIWLVALHMLDSLKRREFEFANYFRFQFAARRESK